MYWRQKKELTDRLKGRIQRADSLEEIKKVLADMIDEIVDAIPDTPDPYHS
jgi:hypothetical protein